MRVHPVGHRGVGLLGWALLTALPASGSAQAPGDLRVEVGTATALPASETGGDAAVYGMTGLGFDWAGERAAASASLFGGLALNDVSGGDFASAYLKVEGWTGRSGVGLVGQAYGFTVGEPYPYRNGTLQGGPAVRWLRGPVRLELRGEVGTGASVVELRRRTDLPYRRFEEHLWHRGVVVEGRVGGGAVALSGSAGSWSSAGGAFRALEVALTAGAGRLVMRVDAGVWDTPLGTEWVGGLALAVPLGGGWSVQGVGGRAGPDPLTLVEAGGQGGVLVGWRVAEIGGAVGPRLYEMVGGPASRPSVAFRLERPEATRVELMGGFTGWEPTPMARDGKTWTVEIAVAPGTHHFGFLVDGEWYVPDGVPGNVPDEWGRVNATLVVPPASQELER